MRSNTVSTILAQHFGADTYLGTIAGDGSVAKTNATTSSAFTIPAGQCIELQGDVAFYVLPTPKVNDDGSTAAVTTSATNGRKVAAGDVYQFSLRPSQSAVSIISVSGAFNVKVWRVD